MTDAEKLVLAIVRANPNRLLQHVGGCPLHQIGADDIAKVDIISRRDGYIDIRFTFDEKSQAVLDILDEGDVVKYNGMSISDAISSCHTPMGFLHIERGEYSNYSNQITGYICRLAKCFLGIEATSIDEVKINLALMGNAYEAVSEAA